MAILPRAADAALRVMRGAFRAVRADRACTGTHEPNEKSAAYWSICSMEPCYQPLILWKAASRFPQYQPCDNTTDLRNAYLIIPIQNICSMLRLSEWWDCSAYGYPLCKGYRAFCRNGADRLTHVAVASLAHSPRAAAAQIPAASLPPVTTTVIYKAGTEIRLTNTAAYTVPEAFFASEPTLLGSRGTHERIRR